MQENFTKLIFEFLNIQIHLSSEFVDVEQLTLFEDCRKPPIIFNGFSSLHMYKLYLYNLYCQFKSNFIYSEEYPLQILQLNECRSFYTRERTETDYIWSHFLSEKVDYMHCSTIQQREILKQCSDFFLSNGRLYS